MSEMLTAVAIIFIVAGPFLLVANRFSLPAAPLLIIAGIIAGRFIDEILALELAQFGIALLVFTFGVTIQLSDIQSIIADSEVAAIGQIAVLGALGTAFGLLVGVPLEESIYIGVAAALSSTMVATALLQTEIRKDLLHGRLSELIQFVQDLFAIGFLLIVGAGVFEADPIATQVGYGVFFLVAAIIVNRYLFRFITRLADDSDELMIVGVISVLVLFMGAAVAADISIVVGAFMAGLAVRYEPGRFLGLFNGIESIKDFFVAILFVTVGALIAFPFIDVGFDDSIQKLVLASGLIVLTVVIKPAVTTAILLYRGYEARTATLTGLSTDQVSEFALIIAIQALIVGFLTQTVFDAIIFAAAVTMVISPLSQPYGDRLYQGLVGRGIISESHGITDELSLVTDDLDDHVIILGFDAEGRRLVDTVEALGQPYVVIDYDPAVWETARVECESYVFGDAMEPYTWEKARAGEAAVIVSLTDADRVSRRLLSFDFDATLILQAQDEGRAIELLDAGASYVSVPNLLAGEQLNHLIQDVLAGEKTRADVRSIGIEILERLTVTESPPR